jgi:hypothetical protein
MTKINNLIVIEVPEKISKFWIHFESISGETRISEDTNGLTAWDLCLEKGLHLDKYKILGKLSELSEEECEKHIQVLKGLGEWIFYDYIDNSPNGFMTAKESLISLLQSHGINTDNPNQILLIKKI